MTEDYISTLEFKQRTDEAAGDVDIGAYPVGKTVQVGHFLVPEEKRGQGRGREVMQAIIDAADAYGAEKIDVNIGYTNHDDGGPHPHDSTVRFLNSMGFTVTPEPTTVSAVMRL